MIDVVLLAAVVGMTTDASAMCPNNSAATKQPGVIMTKATKTEAAQSGTCPMCSGPSVHAFRPFCSRRCADLDLARWLKGNYAIPGPPASPQDLNADEDDQAGFGFDTS